MASFTVVTTTYVLTWAKEAIGPSTFPRTIIDYRATLTFGHDKPATTITQEDPHAIGMFQTGVVILSAAATKKPSSSASSSETTTSASQTSTSPRHNHSPHPGAVTEVPQSKGNSTNLSKGATAGIAVGAVILALLLIAIGYLVYRRRRYRPTDENPVHRSQSRRPYMDNKAELDDTSRAQKSQSMAELQDRSPQEADNLSQLPPPIPFASKPRVELEGNYVGHEVGSPRSPTTEENGAAA
jgi:hypothetical protein